MEPCGCVIYVRLHKLATNKFKGCLPETACINSSKDYGGAAFSRFDSINSSRDFGGPSLSRFDSMNSTKDHGYSFDDADPFGSTGPFKVSSDDQSPKKKSDN
ncbi:hypothetical protein YC2023_043477 [Brassica napus]